MNADRRKTLAKLVNMLDGIAEEIDFASDEEQEYADNMPENLFGCEKHSRAEDIASQLNSAADSLRDIMADLEECAE